MKTDTLKQAARYLEVGSIALALTALTYRATLYWLLPAAADPSHATRDLLDFGLAMLLFVICGLCATSGVAINLVGDRQDRPRAYRAFLIGVISFLAYDILHPHVPRLM